MHSYQTSGPCTPSGSYESTSPTTPSHLPSPASSYAPSRLASNSSGNGSGSDSSAPQTPQSPLPVIISTGAKVSTPRLAETDSNGAGLADSRISAGEHHHARHDIRTLHEPHAAPYRAESRYPRQSGPSTKHNNGRSRRGSTHNRECKYGRVRRDGTDDTGRASDDSGFGASA